MEYKLTPERAKDLQEATNPKGLNTVQRMDIANKIFEKYSMLKNDKGIFHAQLFSAMEEYIFECNKKNNYDYFS